MLPNPCKNGAICQPIGSSYSCSCTAGYSGTNCENCKYLILIGSILKNQNINKIIFISDDPCYQKPCFNSGTCTPMGSSYSCSCPAYFSGRNCENC